MIPIAHAADYLLFAPIVVVVLMVTWLYLRGRLVAEEDDDGDPDQTGEQPPD